ncbi:hypothetical protein L227DRAFT_491842 [Lentinus tigrinus ALCF2SS1-6]|uniref:CCHC-type domain-containing protein n=1 Tax=Lentinus tigrinus ALCF2SS1-6 TaxID=1328759 RepID=A0A5C2SV80_9APHY|nr:hypothetical protein L227DRAFT_491842 [Lentinus tigrinus ALCF2SS1-6]
MPPRGSAGAPSFDPNSDVRSIIGFFEDLEYCFEQAGVDSPREKKDHAVRYAPDTEKNIWRSYPEFKEPMKSWDDFKNAVLAEYIGDGGKMLFTLRDLDMLVSMTAKNGVHSIKEFNEYSRKFRDIATFLVSGGYLREDDRDYCFLQGLQDSFRAQVLERLRITHPQVLAPRQQYSITQVTEAARHILEATVPSSFNHHRLAFPAASASPSTSATTPSPVKSELAEVTEALRAMASAFAQFQRAQLASASQPPVALGPAARQLPPHMSASQSITQPAPGPRTCFYCGDPTHTIRRCAQVEADIQDGLVTRNERLEVVLVNGSYVPSTIPGATLRERVQEYYRQHPEVRSTAPAAPQLFFSPVSHTPPRVADTPVSEARIEELPDEPASDKDAHSLPPVTSQPSSEQPRLQVPSVPAQAPAVPAASQPASSTSAPAAHEPAPPEHPYRDARDATYVPPQQRNFAAPPARPPAPPKKQEPAYRTQAPIYDPRHVANVFKRCMESQITLSQEELLSIAPDVRQQTREACSSRRVAAGPEPVLSFLNSMPVSFAQASRAPPPGAIVVQDPYEVYLRTLPPGEDPVPLRVSLESAAVRAIEGVFCNKARVSCILDSGSAIISMSEGVAHTLGIDYDHRLTIPMQTANGSVTSTLGLARNVPVRFGSIVVYLQIHVIPDAPYDVLLGRPFDVLTSSSVQTNSDGSQTITLYDPNSDLETTIPTLPRIDPEFTRASSDPTHRQKRPSPGFQAGSRI